MAQGLWTVMLAAQGLCILVSLPPSELAARWVVLISWRAQGMGSCQVCGRGPRWSAGHADVPFLFSGHGQSREGYFLEMCASPVGNFPGLDMGDLGDMGSVTGSLGKQPLSLGRTSCLLRKFKPQDLIISSLCV